MTTGSTTQQAWLMSMSLGQQSFQQGRMVDAVGAFSQATKLQPRRIEGWVNLGSALLAAKRFAESAAALSNAITLNPKLMASHMLLGDALRQLGEFNLAIASYRQAVALQRSPLALNKLACALRVKKQVEEARKLYLEAIQLDPRFTLALVNLATLTIEICQFEEARAQLDELASRSLPPLEQKEVHASRQALSEYFRLEGAISLLNTHNEVDLLRAELADTPPPALGKDEITLQGIRRYADCANRLYGSTAEIAGSPPAQWPLIEALFMIPLIDSVAEFQNISEHHGDRRLATGELLESLNMEPAIRAARASHDELLDPIRAEVHLRHWHALACRDVPGFLPGHFKYTQNWSTRSPVLKRVEPVLASGSFRHFIAETYAALQPGLLRAAVVFMGVCDLHLFADGNGRVALIWLNRELEWAGLMPALFRRDLGLKDQLGKAMKEVRTNGGDLSPLVAVIVTAQHYALEFCAQLAER